MSRYGQIAFTSTVRAVQREHGSARARARIPDQDLAPDLLTADEAAFVQSLDGFYLASVGQTGWPYLQFRGGPPGFVHVLDESTLAFAEVRGNRQYITTGNLRSDDRVALFFMDYAHRSRLKMLGHAKTMSADEAPELAARLETPRTDGRVEHLMIIRIEGYGWNCHQHITPRYTEAELDTALQPVRERLARLEEENTALRAALRGDAGRHM